MGRGFVGLPGGNGGSIYIESVFVAHSGSPADSFFLACFLSAFFPSVSAMGIQRSAIVAWSPSYGRFLLPFPRRGQPRERDRGGRKSIRLRARAKRNTGRPFVLCKVTNRPQSIVAISYGHQSEGGRTRSPKPSTITSISRATHASAEPKMSSPF